MNSADLGTTFNGLTTAEKLALKTAITGIEKPQVTDATAITLDVSTVVNTAEVTTLVFDAANTGVYNNVASGTTRVASRKKLSETALSACPISMVKSAPFPLSSFQELTPCSPEKIPLPLSIRNCGTRSRTKTAARKIISS